MDFPVVQGVLVKTTEPVVAVADVPPIVRQFLPLLVKPATIQQPHLLREEQADFLAGAVADLSTTIQVLSAQAAMALLDLYGESTDQDKDCSLQMQEILDAVYQS
jgi:hypothetical protein